MQPIEYTRAHCVDPETLAAWVDGGLAAPAAIEVEAHLSTCARCQAVLAALSATDVDTVTTAAPAVVLPFWSRRPVQRAAAALAAAASLTLWTMNRSEPAPMPIATPESVTVQAPPPTPAPGPAELQKPSPAPSASKRITPRPPEPASAPAEPPAPAPPEPAPVFAASPPAPPPPLPAAVAPPPPPPPVNPGMAATPVRQEQRASNTQVAYSGLRPAFEVIAISDQSELAASALAPPGGGRGGAGRGAAGNVAGRLVQPPQVRWRVTGPTVERSLDSGRTWERLEMDQPFTLTAGSAPFQNVCWFVGRNGVVFRTTNGTSFERMTPPHTVDLRAIVASDSLRAVVTAVDGRIFETTDGGVTWTLRT